jgi:hypothetical protein
MDESRERPVGAPFSGGRGNAISLVVTFIERVIHELGSEHGDVGSGGTTGDDGRHHLRRQEDELGGSTLGHLNDSLLILEAALDGQSQITVCFSGSVGLKGSKLDVVLLGLALLDATAGDGTGDDEDANYGSEERKEEQGSSKGSQDARQGGRPILVPVARSVSVLAILLPVGGL